MFAQLMAEMLNPKAFESYRVYSLDTTARLDEALELCEDVKLSRIPAATLVPIFGELDWSLKNDPAALALAPPEIESLFEVIKNKNNVSLNDFGFHLVLLRKRLDVTYKIKIEQLILSCFDVPNKKGELRKLVGFYCSHLINSGYSRRHVNHLVGEYFFSKQLLRVGKPTLNKFFREFDGKHKKFVVHAAVTKDLGHYLKGLSFAVREISSLTPEQQRTFSTNHNFSRTPLAIEISVERLDPFGAAAFGHLILGAQRAISYLDPTGMSCEWGDTVHVTKAKAQSGSTISKGDLLLTATSPKTSASGNRLRSISNYARSIFTNFDKESTERLLSSINTASLARTSVNPENQLISFWSAIEVLLSEPRDQPRIVHYAGLITPCITLRHTRRQVTYLFDRLLVTYKHKFRKILEPLANGSPPITARNFASMMFLPEHAASRQALCEILSENPLALHRVWKLHHDYRDIKSAETTVRDHYNRVSWQLHRIYRARNQLVHSGKMPSYLESVILNLAEYYRSSIATLINRAKTEHYRSDIDQIVAEIGIQYGIVTSKLQKRGPSVDLTPDHVRLLMDYND